MTIRNLLLAGLLATVALPLAAAVGEEARPRTAYVTGQGEVSAEPDLAHVTLGVESRKPTMAEARAEVAATVERVLALTRARSDDWNPPVVLTCATDPDSIAALSREIDRHFDWLARSGRRDRQRLERRKYRLRRWLERRIDEIVDRQPHSFFDLPAEQQVADLLRAFVQP